MSELPSSYNPRRFRTTVPYYARYRLGYPDSLIARVAAFAGLRPGDKVMDLGSGPGLLAIPFARLGLDVLAVDPEPAMLEAAGEAAREAGVKISLRQGSSFDLPVDAAPFRLVSMGRSFHWMNGMETLLALDMLVTKDGALAFFDDNHPPTSENAWRRKTREIGEKFGRNQSPHLVAAHSPGFRTHHSLLFDSPFSKLDGLSTFVRRELAADEVVGLGFSLSTCSRERLGDQAEAFEKALRAELAQLSPEGRFIEIAEVCAQVARRGTPSV
jgi:SAM-dependent methyltransferase